MSGLFENLALSDDSEIIAHRQATAVANKRVKDQLGAFLANADSDLPARLALVEDTLREIVEAVTIEYGGDAQKIEAAIKKSFMPPQPGMGDPAMGNPAMGGGQGVCPQCGGQDPNCPACHGGTGAYGGQAGSPGGAYGLTHSIPQAPSTGPVMASHEAAGGFCDNCHNWKSGPNAGCTCDGGEASEDTKESSVREARRPKLCPYHSEVVDISLGAGDPQAGYNAMAAHAWGDKHCKGAYGGACNFRPSMVTQKYWDDKQNEYAERREQRERDRAQQPLEELSIDTEPIMHAEPLPDEPGKEGVTDIDGELANAPSAVGAGELAMAASTQKEAEALKTVDLPTGDESALGGPSPKIDKGKSGDQGGWFLDPIDTEMDGSPNPGVKQDPTDKADYNKEDFEAQTKPVNEEMTLPTGKGLDGGGYDTTRNIEQYPTQTFGDNGTDPVTNQALSSVHAGLTHEAKDWIQDAVKRPGQLHRDLGVPEGENIPEDKLEEAEHSQNKKVRERAQFAENMKHLNAFDGVDPWSQAVQAYRSGQGPHPAVALPDHPNAETYYNSLSPEQQTNMMSTPGNYQGVADSWAQQATSAVDPDKNPIREVMEEYSGYLMPNEVESALQSYERNP